MAGPVLAGGGILLRFAGPQPDRNWEGGILFDDGVIDIFAVRGDARGPLATMTDVMFFGAMGYRLVDSAIMPGVNHGAWDVGLQMSFIDLEAFGVVAAVLWGSHLFIGRERPYVAVCREDPGFAERAGDCDPSDDWNRSFISGHPAVGVAAASLTCLHHSRMPLYGGGVADGVACGLTIVAAAANGVGRVITEKHYASDLILGVGLGLVAGYVIPKSLHYGWGTPAAAPERPVARTGLEVRAAVVPTATRGGGGVAVIGSF